MEKQFTVLSYNIDGLNNADLAERTAVAVGIILSESPDVVFLQEVIDATEPLLRTSLETNGYVCCGEKFSSGKSQSNFHMPYFTLSFVKSSWRNGIGRVHLSVQRREFSESATSFQGRNLLRTVVRTCEAAGCVACTAGLLFVNCHLESCGRAMKSRESEIRQSQLRMALAAVMNHDGPAIIGGDLNIRDSEAQAVLRTINKENPSIKSINDHGQRLHPKSLIVNDAAEVLDHVKTYTWFFPGKESVQYRFDRIYSNKHSGLQPVELKTVGDEKIFSSYNAAGESRAYLTPSDHRGLLVRYKYIYHCNGPNSMSVAVNKEEVGVVDSGSNALGTDRTTKDEYNGSNHILLASHSSSLNGGGMDRRSVDSSNITSSIYGRGHSIPSDSCDIDRRVSLPVRDAAGDSTCLKSDRVGKQKHVDKKSTKLRALQSNNDETAPRFPTDNKTVIDLCSYDEEDSISTSVESKFASSSQASSSSFRSFSSSTLDQRAGKAAGEAVVRHYPATFRSITAQASTMGTDFDIGTAAGNADPDVDGDGDGGRAKKRRLFLDALEKRWQQD